MLGFGEPKKAKPFTLIGVFVCANCATKCEIEQDSPRDYTNTFTTWSPTRPDGWRSDLCMKCNDAADNARKEALERRAGLRD